MIESLFTEQARYEHPHAIFYMSATILTFSVFFLVKTIRAMLSVCAAAVTDNSSGGHLNDILHEIKSATKAEKDPTSTYILFTETHLDIKNDDQAFSTNIFAEMAIDDLKTEYARTKSEILKYKAELLKYNIAEPRVRQFLKRTSEKTKDIKKALNKHLVNARIYKVEHT